MIQRFVLAVLLAAAPAVAQPPSSQGVRTSTSPADRQTAVAILNAWVPFDSNSATIGGIAQSILDDKAAVLQLNRSLKVRINSTGRDGRYGQGASLADRRNQAVRAYLLDNSVAADQ